MLRDNKGFIFVEILVAVAFIGVVFVTLLGIGFSVLNVSASIKKEVQANFLAKEEIEALRNFRDGTQWASNGLGVVNTGVGNPYYLVDNSGAWALVGGAETIGIFARNVFIDRASREPGTQNIESTYNSYNDDSDTRKITAVVNWPGHTLQIVSFLTNWAQ